MNRKRNRNQNANPLPRQKSKEKFFGTVAIILAVTILALGGLGWWMLSRPGAREPQASAAEVAPALIPKSGARVLSDFQKLAGKWVRPDGGYVIDVKRVTETGSMEAAYYNPRPIHVARAEASRNGAALHVFVELRDVNYPGSTYNLTYDPASDRLEGTYYQALLQQSYEISFVRSR